MKDAGLSYGDLRNHWLHRLRIKRAAAQKHRAKNVPFVPPIYRLAAKP